MARIDRLDPYSPIVLTRNDVPRFLGYRLPSSSILVLLRGQEALLIERTAPWTFDEAVSEAQFRDYDDFCTVNNDGTRDMGVLTEGRHVRPAVSTRLAVSA